MRSLPLFQTLRKDLGTEGRRDNWLCSVTEWSTYWGFSHLVNPGLAYGRGQDLHKRSCERDKDCCSSSCMWFMFLELFIYVIWGFGEDNVPVVVLKSTFVVSKFLERDCCQKMGIWNPNTRASSELISLSAWSQNNEFNCCGKAPFQSMTCKCTVRGKGLLKQAWWTAAGKIFNRSSLGFK